MRALVLLLIILFGMGFQMISRGQSLSAEMAGMQTEWSLKGTLSDDFGRADRWNYSVASRICSDYIGEELAVLSLGNVGYKLNPSFSTMIGGIYVTNSGFKPNVGIQYTREARKEMRMLAALSLMLEYNIPIHVIIFYLRLIQM